MAPLVLAFRFVFGLDDVTSQLPVAVAMPSAICQLPSLYILMDSYSSETKLK